MENLDGALFADNWFYSATFIFEKDSNIFKLWHGNARVQARVAVRESNSGPGAPEALAVTS